jgi:cytochrome b involved in lipid metabolism
MRNKSLLIMILVIFLVSVFVLFLKKDKWYSFSQVQAHADSKSCWIVIEKTVYDVTSLVNSHTGGSKNILSVCGKDGSSVFGKKHGEQDEIISEMEKYKIGIVAY